jgi:hypothetical protein
VRIVRDGLVRLGQRYRSHRGRVKTSALHLEFTTCVDAPRANARRVTVNGLEVQGWTIRDGSLVTTMPDRFERMEIRIE